MRKFFLLCAAAVLATGFSVNNAQAEGLGLGYLYGDAPIGIFYDMDGSYLAAGVGFHKYDVPTGSAAIETEITVAGSWTMDMKSGDAWGFGPAVGAKFTNMSPQTGDSSSMTTISLGLRGHWDATSNVSFWFGHGIDIDITSPPVGDSTTDFGTSGMNVTDFGFTVWMP